MKIWEILHQLNQEKRIQIMDAELRAMLNYAEYWYIRKALTGLGILEPAKKRGRSVIVWSINWKEAAKHVDGLDTSFYEEHIRKETREILNKLSEARPEGVPA